MASYEENGDTLHKCGMPWKLLPKCFRGKTDPSLAKKKKGGEKMSMLDVTFSPVRPTYQDRERKKDETGFETNEPKNIEENISLPSKKKLKCRKSLTYGQCYNCDRVKHTPSRDTDDKTTENSLHRPLHREKSCHRRDHPEFLTKNEARKRLLSWQKTTIVRKNSEQQYC